MDDINLHSLLLTDDVIRWRETSAAAIVNAASLWCCRQNTLPVVTIIIIPSISEGVSAPMMLGQYLINYKNKSDRDGDGVR